MTNQMIETIIIDERDAMDMKHNVHYTFRIAMFEETCSTYFYAAMLERSLCIVSALEQTIDNI